MGMRTRNSTTQRTDENNGANSLDIAMSSSNTSSTSSSPTRTLHRSGTAPTASDTPDIVSSTPLLLPHKNINAATPSPFVRRSLTYAPPPKRPRNWSNMLSLLLLALIVMSILTMFWTMLLVNTHPDEQSKQGHNTPPFSTAHKKPSRKTATISDHPWVRGGEHDHQQQQQRQDALTSKRGQSASLKGEGKIAAASDDDRGRNNLEGQVEELDDDNDDDEMVMENAQQDVEDFGNDDEDQEDKSEQDQDEGPPELDDEVDTETEDDVDVKETVSRSDDEQADLEPSDDDDDGDELELDAETEDEVELEEAEKSIDEESVNSGANVVLDSEQRSKDEQEVADTMNDAQLDLINDVALQESDANGDDEEEDSLQDREDFADAPPEHHAEDPRDETEDDIETDRGNGEGLGVSLDPIVVEDVDAEDEAATDAIPGQYPRVFFHDLDGSPSIRTHRKLPDDEMLRAPPGFEAVEQDRMRADKTQDGDCVPMHDWQVKSFPNCNLVHEYDMKAAGPGVYKNNTNAVLEDSLELLGQGWFRHTWRLDAGATRESVVLKTLRLEREFYDEFYDLHRRDAVAMERLTHSPFIMDIYGYCGQSALNELAEFGRGTLPTLEKVDRRMRGKEDAASYVLRLQLGASVAVGVAHIHEIDDDHVPSMVHYDLNPRNIAMVGGGKPKINDFNIAEFVHWNPKTNESCGFPSRLHEPWWRAPEEVSLNPENGTGLTSAVDVYALGSILHHVLTTHSPRGKMKKERAEEVREKVLRGEPPDLDERYTQSKNPVIIAFRKAMKLCFEPDPKKRGTARQVADILLAALMERKRAMKEKKARGH